MKPQKVTLFNPDTKDFTVTYDINGDGEPLPFTIHAKEYEQFEPVIAEHITKHLARHLVFSRGIKANFEADFDKARQEIEVAV